MLCIAVGLGRRVDRERDMHTKLARKPEMLTLVGPTASGKTELAFSLASRFSGEIVNFDSRQVYKEFPLITDQPPRRYRDRVPHWLYGFLDIQSKIDACYFAKLAREVIRDIQSRNTLPILVGGSGLYLDAILYGLDPIPEVPGEIRQEVLRDWEQKGDRSMYKRLQRMDPDYASKIHPNDKQRITRALEVGQSSWRPFSEWHTKGTSKSRYQALNIGIWLGLSVLRAKLEQRIDKMLRKGAIQEVQQAWWKSPREDAQVWSGIGCYELLQYVLGRWSLQEARRYWSKRTKKYAKRQLTWFKKQKDIVWCNNTEDARELAANCLEDFGKQRF